MQFKTLRLFFMPLFIVNSALLLWCHDASAQRGSPGGLAALFNLLKRPETRVLPSEGLPRANCIEDNKITFEYVKNLLQQNDIDNTKIFVENLTEHQFNQLIDIIISNFKELTYIFPSNGPIFLRDANEYMVLRDANEYMVQALLNHKPEVAEQFVQPALDNIEQIHPWIVRHILRHKPEVALQFVQPAINNIDTIHTNTIYEILHYSPEAFQQFIQHARDNITQIDPDIINYILNHKPKAARQFVQPALDNITQIHPYIIRHILDSMHFFSFRFYWHKPEIVHQFAQRTLENITQIDPDTIDYILRHKPKNAHQFGQYALDNIDTISLDLLAVLPVKCNAKAKKVLARLQQKESDDLNTIFKILILSKKIYKKQNCRIKCCTQTCHHLRNNIDRLLWFYGELFEMANKVNQKEKELQKEYYTFVHGQRWEYQFAEHLFTKLYEWANKKNCPEFLFAHMKKLSKDLDEENLHEELLTKGRTNDESRQRLLFLNYAFFGNSRNRGSSTAYYIANNRNVGTIKIGLQELFEWNNLEDIYLKYESELIKLQEEHNSLSRFGNLLMVAVPKDIVDKCIFPATIGGYKKEAKEKGWICGSKIDKASEILEAIKEDAITNSDEIEFCLAMTRAKHGGLNEDSGIKFFDFNAVDEKAWAAYKEKEEELFARIAKDIETSKFYEMSYPKLK